MTRAAKPEIHRPETSALPLLQTGVRFGWAALPRRGRLNRTTSSVPVASAIRRSVSTVGLAAPDSHREILA